MKAALLVEKKTIRQLYVLARRTKVPKWHGMSKENLIKGVQQQLPRFPEIARELLNEVALDARQPLRKKATSTKPLIGKEKSKGKVPVSSNSPNNPPASSVTSPKKAIPLVKGTKEEKVAPPKPIVSKIVPSPKTASKKGCTVSDSSVAVAHVKISPKGVKKVAPKKKDLPEPVKPKPIKKDSVKDLVSTTVIDAPAEPVKPTKVAATKMVSGGQDKIALLKEKLLMQKSLGGGGTKREARDQLILMVRDPFWLHAYWEISSTHVDRIRAAMGHLWHTADPVLRVFKIHTEKIGSSRQEYINDIKIHGGLNSWYIGVDNPPCQFYVEIGYLARDGQFFALISSNMVETPQRSFHDSFGHPDICRMGVPNELLLGNGPEKNRLGNLRDAENSADLVDNEESSTIGVQINNGSRKRRFNFEVDADLIIRGKASTNVQLSVRGETIRVKEDGTFLIRYHLPERRHVFPVVVVSPDGVETQTTILAIERNTKVLETVIRDDEDD